MSNLSNYPPGVTGQEDAITGGSEEATDNSVNLLHFLVGTLTRAGVSVDSIDTTYGTIDLTILGDSFTLYIVENLT